MILEDSLFIPLDQNYSAPYSIYIVFELAVNKYSDRRFPVKSGLNGFQKKRKKSKQLRPI